MVLIAGPRCEDAAALGQEVLVVGHVDPGHAALVLVAVLVEEGSVLGVGHFGSVDEEGVERDAALRGRALGVAVAAHQERAGGHEYLLSQGDAAGRGDGRWGSGCRTGARTGGRRGDNDRRLGRDRWRGGWRRGRGRHFATGGNHCRFCCLGCGGLLAQPRIDEQRPGQGQQGHDQPRHRPQPAGAAGGAGRGGSDGRGHLCRQHDGRTGRVAQRRAGRGVQRLVQCGGAGQAAADVGVHGRQDGRLDARADGRVQRARRGQQRPADQHHALRRLLPGQHPVERCSQGVDVAAGVGAGGAILLRRAVAGGDGPRADGRALAGGELLGDAEVDQHGPAVGADDDVIGLDVAVDDRRRARVEILQCVAHLANPRQHLGLAQRPTALEQQVGQALALDEVHHQVLPLAGQDEVVADAGQIGVAQISQQMGLALELALGVRAGVGVDLQGHGHLEVDVPGAIDRAETALADQADDSIATLQLVTDVHTSPFGPNAIAGHSAGAPASRAA